MADSFVRVPTDDVGKRVDASSLDVGADTVYRQRIAIADNSATAAYAAVLSSSAVGTEGGLVVRPVTSTVVLAANSIVNISNTPAVVLAAGTANIGLLNNISATVTVAGTVSLGPSTANIGVLNNISATVTVVTNGYTPAVMSASQGPKCVTASTSGNVTLIASPGAGANVYVTRLMCGNVSATLTRARIGTSASIATVVQPLAASGGGFVFEFDPPWMVSASEAVLCSVKPNVADVFFTVQFFVI